MSAEAGLTLLAEAGRVLGASLDLDETFARVARLSVPALADVALFDLLEPGQPPRRVAVAVADPEREAMAGELLRYPPRGASHPVLEAARTASARMLSPVPDQMLRAVAHDARHLEILHALGFVSVVEAPLVARHAVLGVLTLARARVGA